MRKSLAFGAVLLVCMAAFAGMCAASDHSDAATATGSGTSDDPYTSFNGTPVEIRNKYVDVGATITINGGNPNQGYITGAGNVAEFGLALNGSTISGTVAWPGDIVFPVQFIDGSGGNVTVHAIELQTSFTHTVTYSPNGGTGTMSPTVVTDENSGSSNVTLASNGFSRTGYTFFGWSVDGNVYQPGQGIPVPADGTVNATAKWDKNTLNVVVNGLAGVSGQTYSNQISASVNHQVSNVSYAVKSCTGGTATVNSSGLVTYTAPTVDATSTYTVTVTVTANFLQGGPQSKEVSFTVTVDPILSFTNAATSGTLTIKGV